MSETTDLSVEERVAAAADRLYCAECALHAAFESHEDGWIAAAYERLHEAIGCYDEAVAAR